MAKTDIPAWVKVTMGVILFAIAVWGTAWAASKGSTGMIDTVSFHETRILKIEAELQIIDKRLDGTEKTQIAIQKDQQALLKGQNEMKAQIQKQNELMIEQIKYNAEIQAWLKSIEKVE